MILLAVLGCRGWIAPQVLTNVALTALSFLEQGTCRRRGCTVALALKVVGCGEVSSRSQKLSHGNNVRTMTIRFQIFGPVIVTKLGYPYKIATLEQDVTVPPHPGIPGRSSFPDRRDGILIPWRRLFTAC